MANLAVPDGLRDFLKVKAAMEKKPIARIVYEALLKTHDDCPKFTWKGYHVTEKKVISNDYLTDIANEILNKKEERDEIDR